MAKIIVQNTQITVIKQNENDYICLTDMLKAKDGEFFFSNWLRNRNTIESIVCRTSADNLAKRHIAHTETYQRKCHSIVYGVDNNRCIERRCTHIDNSEYHTCNHRNNCRYEVQMDKSEEERRGEN